jgi:hypothetical protein
MRATVAIVAFSAVWITWPAVAQQEPSQNTWQLTFAQGWRGEIKDMKIASNGDIVVAGFMPPDRGGASDAWVARVDQAGHALWSKRFGSRQRDEILSLALSPDGGIVVGGWRDIGSLVSPFASNGFVAKLSSSGDVLWNHTITEPDQRVLISQVAALDDGGALIAGSRNSEKGEGQSSVLLERIERDGSVRWAFDPTNTPIEMPPPYDFSAPDGRTLHVRNALPGSGTFAIRTDRTVELWLSRLGNLNMSGARCVVVALDTGKATGEACRGPTALVQHSADGIALVGGATTPIYNGDPIFRRYDGAGAVLWERILESPEGDGAYRSAATPDGGVIGAGFRVIGERVEMHNWDGLLIKLDAAGNEIWRRQYGGSRRDEFSSVAVASDGSIIVAGYTGSQGAQEWWPWVLRLNASGELEGEAKANLERRQQ